VVYASSLPTTTLLSLLQDMDGEGVLILMDPILIDLFIQKPHRSLVGVERFRTNQRVEFWMDLSPDGDTIGDLKVGGRRRRRTRRKRRRGTSHVLIHLPVC